MLDFLKSWAASVTTTLRKRIKQIINDRDAGAQDGMNQHVHLVSIVRKTQKQSKAITC